jgi:glutathione synthase/RimK-type ligase-like ATP-grasp enzyme
METLSKKVINPSSIEFECYSKLRTMLHFWAWGVPIPKTVYVPCDAIDITKDGREIHNEFDIAELLQSEIATDKGIVVKPDAGTHGKGIVLAKTTKNSSPTSRTQGLLSLIPWEFLRRSSFKNGSMT